jgi:hypothetical protein
VDDLQFPVDAPELPDDDLGGSRKMPSMAFFFTEKRKTRSSLSFIFNHLSRLKMPAHPCAARAPRFFEAPLGKFLLGYYLNP